MLNKNLAGAFAFFLGMFGVHRFYLGQAWRGALQFAGFWGIVAMLAEEGPEMPLPFVLVALIIAPMITGIIFWATPYEKWAAKYDKEALNRHQGYADVPSLGPGRPASLKSLKAEGVRYYRSGDYDLAVEAFEEAAGLEPTDPVAHFNLACCYSLLGRYPAALKCLERAVTFNLPKPERIERHPALRDLRRSPTYTTFRSNNYRRLNLLHLGGAEAPPVATTQPETETLEDFEAPPPPRSEASRQREREEPAATAPPPHREADLLEQITRLRELHDAGILTEAEYAKQREKLLG